MVKIKEKNDFNSNFQIKFLYKHFKDCNKIYCNCKLLSMFIKNNKEIEEENKSYLLIILNYLFESSFLEYDYYNKYEMAILLSEHFCYI